MDNIFIYIKIHNYVQVWINIIHWLLIFCLIIFCIYVKNQKISIFSLMFYDFYDIDFLINVFHLK